MDIKIVIQILEINIHLKKMFNFLTHLKYIIRKSAITNFNDLFKNNKHTSDTF